MALRAKKVWNEDLVQEWKQASAEHPDAHVGSIFPLVGVKNFESMDPNEHRWKGRVVLGGDRIKKANGQWAIFEDVGSTPASMQATRIAIALDAAVKMYQLLQSDCIRAYVQALLSGPKTFIRMPKAWWPKSWHKFVDPVCPLDYALYGHPAAGDCWADRFAEVLLTLGFKKVEGWMAVFIHQGPNGDTVTFIVYVDDLVMLGGPRMIKLIGAVREHIEMDEPAGLQKYLGVHHAKECVELGGHVQTTYTFEMRSYFNAIGERFIKETGLKLTRVSTPNAPDLTTEEFIELHERPGTLEGCALSFIMAYMYGSRMALPTIAVVIQRLATLVTKWSAEADRRLHRLACYVHSHLDEALTGCLSTADIDSLEIVAWPDADLNGDVLTYHQVDKWRIC
jgi:hypothetical protein